MAESSTRPRKRHQVQLACNRCRKMKAAVSYLHQSAPPNVCFQTNHSNGQCDSAKPTCGRCAKRDLACVYAQELEENETRSNAQRREAAANKARLDKIEDAFRFLRTLPEREAARCIKEVVQSNENPLDVLTSLAHGSSRSVPTAIDVAASTVLPSRRCSLSFELTRTHPHSYPPLVSVEQWAAYPKGSVGPQRVESS
jgi:hypothetical protein